MRVAAPASFGPAVHKAGFEHVPLADAAPEELGAVFARLPALSRLEANEVVVREVFGGLGARAALPAMQIAAEQWRPDLILREMAEFASYVVAERSGIPHAQVMLSVASVGEFWDPMIDKPLRTLGSTLGAAGLRAAPQLTLVPESLDDEARPRSAHPQVPSRPAAALRRRPAG